MAGIEKLLVSSIYPTENMIKRTQRNCQDNRLLAEQ
jgi:hypothetical protein